MFKRLTFLFAFQMYFTLHAADQPASIQAAKQEKESNKDESIVLFTPPNGWMMADPSSLPTHVHSMVVGKGPTNFPPSLNISSEPYKGTLKEYLKIIKNMNSAQGYEWKDLGTIQTEAGTASLSQVDTKTQWGIVRLMHVILVRNGQVYILTASALRDEYSNFYKQFFDSMKSLKIIQDLYSLIPDAKERLQLKSETDTIKAQWQKQLAEKKKENPEMALNDIQDAVFDSENFQKNVWIPFVEKLKEKNKTLGEEWQSLFLQKLEDQLFETTP